MENVAGSRAPKPATAKSNQPDFPLALLACLAVYSNGGKTKSPEVDVIPILLDQRLAFRPLPNLPLVTFALQRLRRAIL